MINSEELSKKFNEMAAKAESIAVYFRGISNDLVKYPNYTAKHAGVTLSRMKKDFFALMKQMDQTQKKCE